jgi:membrane protein
MARRALPLAEPELAAAEGASPAMVRMVTLITRRWSTVGRLASFCAAVYGRYWRHRGAVLAGGLAFFGMLSLVPSLLTLGALLALVVDPVDFVASLNRLMTDNPEAAGALGPVVEELTTISTSSQTAIGLAGLVGLGFSLYAASRFVYVCRQVLDISFELRPRPPSVLTRAVSILITLGFQVVLLVGLAVLSVVPRVLERLGLGHLYAGGASSVRLVIAATVVYLLLTAGMRYGTSLRVVPWVNLGAAVGSLIMVIGSWGLGWYLGASLTYSQIVAVLGSVIALELWLYVIGLALVLSAEVEAVRLRQRHGLVSADPAPSRSTDARSVPIDSSTETGPDRVSGAS